MWVFDRMVITQILEGQMITRITTKPAIERFLNNIAIDDNGCWFWIAGKTLEGYSTFQVNLKKIRAHRFIYKYYYGNIPKNLILDHLCRNRACVNPAHLEPVTHKENILRGKGVTAINAKRTSCIYGHPLSGNNLYIQPNGQRCCRECGRNRDRKYYHRDIEKTRQLRRKKRQRNQEHYREYDRQYHRAHKNQNNSPEGLE